MRYRIAFALVAFSLAVLFLEPDATHGQGRGKGGFGGGGIGGGGFKGNRDPNYMFDQFAKGRPYFLVSDSNRLGGPLNQFLLDRGITSGQVTRDLFIAFNDEMKTRMMGGPGAFPRGGGFPSPGGFQQPGGFQGPGAFPGAGPQNPVDRLTQWAEADFNRLDRNGDGFLNQDEMPEQLKAELTKWDTNRDNLISLDEYKAYFAARMQNRGRGGNQPNDPVTIILEEEDLDVRPVVFRAGKLPKDLPDWFVKLDTDKDGQVALHEWRKGGYDIEEFREWDRNNDGFITAEEAQYKQRLLQLASTSVKSDDDGSPALSVQAARTPDMARGQRGGGGNKKGKGGKGRFQQPQD